MAPSHQSEQQRAELNLLKNCDQCGIKARHSQFTPTQRASFVPPYGVPHDPTHGVPRARVLVVMGEILEGEGMVQTAYDIPRVQQFVAALKRVGWDDAGIRNNFAWCWETRCPKPGDAKTIKLEQRRLCSDITRSDIELLQPELVVYWHFDRWAAFGKARTKATVTGRAIPVEKLVYHQCPGGKWGKGEIERTHKHHVLTVDDPAAVMRAPDEYDPEAWFNDLNKIAGVLNGTYPNDPFAGKQYETVTDAERAIQLLDWYAQQPLTAWDIETGNAPHAVDPYSDKFKILGISISAAPGTASFIPLFHKDCTLGEDPRVMEAVKRYLEGPGYKVAHNGVSFDGIAFRAKHGITTRVDFDTMVACGELNENGSVRLKDQVAMRVPSLGHYEDEMAGYFPKGLAKEKRDYELHLPFEVCARYACADSDGTLQLYQDLVEKMRAIPNPVWGTMLDIFISHRMPDAWAAADMSFTGAVVDPARVKGLRERLSAEVKQVNEELHARPEVRAFMQHKSGEMLGKGLWYFDGKLIYESAAGAQAGFSPIFDPTNNVEYQPGARDRLYEQRVIRKNGAPIKSKLYTYADITFNPAATADIAFMAEKVLSLKSTKQTSKGADSWDEEVLKALSGMSDFCALILKWRHITKAENTYARPVTQGEYTYLDSAGKQKTRHGWIKDDGLVHADFLLCGADRGFDIDASGGTRTKRKSSRDPNLQNVEKHSEYGKALYGLFVSRFRSRAYPFAFHEEHAQWMWDNVLTAEEKSYVKGFVYPGQSGGGCILQIDYSQLELRLFAIVVGCAWMIERYQRGADLHAELAMEVFRASEEEVYGNHGRLRSAAKKLWFGPIYGQGAKGMWIEMRKMGIPSVTTPGELITYEEVKEILERTYAKMPEFDAFKELVKRSLDQTQCIYSLSGARRYLPQWLSTDEYLKSKALRQAVNFTIQNLGAECTNASNYLVQNFLATGYRSVVFNNVHDSLVIDCPSEELPMVTAHASHIMTNPPIPALAADLLPIPLIAEGEVGPDWGALSGIADGTEQFRVNWKRPKEAA